MERLVVGLGNPGPRYAGTRHNVGFDVVSALAEAEGISLDRAGFDAVYGAGPVAGQATAVLLPQTFMNDSGRAVAAALEAWPGLRPVTDLLVVYDDLDLPLGRIRLRPSGRAGGQRGRASPGKGIYTSPLVYDLSRRNGLRVDTGNNTIILIPQ